MWGKPFSSILFVVRLGAHPSVDDEALSREVRKRLDVLLPNLLVEEAGVPVTGSGTLVERLTVYGVSHCQVQPLGRGNSPCPGKPGRETFSAQALALQTPPPFMFPPGLYALADDGARPELSVEAQVDALLEGGVRVLQLRLKRTAGAAAVALAAHAVARARAAGAVLLVNDRVDWALLSGADGVHLGAEDLRLEEARRLLGKGALIGATVRSAQEAEAARAAGADYVGLGPIFMPRSKQVAVELLGLGGLRRVVAQTRTPVVAIGGVGLDSIRAVARAGAYGAAVVSDLLGAEDIARRVRLLQEEFLRGVEERGVP